MNKLSFYPITAFEIVQTKFLHFRKNNSSTLYYLIGSKIFKYNLTAIS